MALDFPLYLGALFVKSVFLPLLLSLLLVGGCASHPDSEPQPSQDQQQARVMEIASGIEQLEVVASDDDLAWFATAAMRRGRDALAEARAQHALFAAQPDRMYERLGVFSTRSRAEAAEDALTDARQAFAQAQRVRSLAEEALAEAFANRQVLRQLEAPRWYPDAYELLELRLKSLVDLVAAERLTRVTEGEPALLAQQHQLEVKTVRRIYLAPHRTRLEELNNEGLDLTAPQTYQAAAHQLDRAWQAVERNPRDLDGIARQAEITRFAVAHAHHLGNELQQLDLQEKPEREIYLLSLEAQLARLAEVLGLPDLREYPLQQQLKQLLLAAETAMPPGQLALAEEETPEVPSGERDLVDTSGLAAEPVQELNAESLGEPDSER
ncbi:hypothetical protein [Ferrimonas gelatinilytica]|uniref:DUF4398 domain-containing protein n=1 Tax=Ferrimonas gelatinilytica TaxID=1255257 RepID=A0ABP9SCF3_9GAMM